MKSLLILISLVGVMLASPVDSESFYKEEITNSNPVGEVSYSDPINPKPYYHKRVGIPLAKSIKETEEAMKLEDDGYELNERIIGGSLNPVGVSPYMGGIVITLKYGGDSVCGSSLLSNTRSLTAAHCWYDGDEETEEFELVHGSSTLYYGGVRTKTKNITMHEDYDYDFLDNDIAMINHTSIEYTDVISPIELPLGELSNYTFAGMWAQAVGYGRNATNKTGDFIRDQPQKIVDVQVMLHKDCRKSFSVWSSMICTRNGPEDAPLGTCQGDSGGPLSISINGSRYLIGITSYGDKVCERLPSVYTRVTEYIDWITELL